MTQSGSFLERQKSANKSSEGANQELETKVVGVTFGNRQQVILRLSVGDIVWLRREPTNQYDANAIRVDAADGNQIGYIARELAERLAPSFDLHCKDIPATITALVGGSFSDSSRGVRIRFTCPAPIPLSKKTPEELDI